MAQDFIKALPMATFNSANMLATYQPINTPGLSRACFCLLLTNQSNSPCIISLDGINDADYMFATSIKILPPVFNQIPNNRCSIVAAGTQIWVKGTAGVGTIYLAAYYL